MYISKEDGLIKLRQFELMAHAIGFNRDKIKYNKYKAYRNHFSTSEDSSDYKDLNNLAKKGYMIERKCNFTCGGIIFHVTKKGFNLFEKMYICTVSEVD